LSVQQGNVVLQVSGKLSYVTLPPESSEVGWRPSFAEQQQEQVQQQADAGDSSSSPQQRHEAAAAGAAQEAGGGSDEADEDSPAAAAAAAADSGAYMDPADLDLLESLHMASGKAPAKRPEYKFNKKAARSKGDRGQGQDGGGYDGAQLAHGKKGGVVRMTSY
jgi:large subunit GTPase 1